jgi:DNA-binding transcriptional LysR family regulator
VTPVPDVALGELAAFVVVCQEASFTRAGRRLHLSQPGVSGRIMRLERALGVRLLDRTTRSVELTRAGRELLPVAVEAVRSLTEARARMTDGGPRRSVALAT